jgi:hypothetical protein
MSRKYKFHYNFTRITSTLRVDICTFVIISRLTFLRMRDVSDKVIAKIKTHFMFNNFFENIVLCMRYVEKYGRARQATCDNLLRHTCYACWVTKVRDTHSEYVISTAFSQRKWFRESVSTLRLYVHCLSQF